uniref:ULP_PROTEASE domain-containing protein n=1 Tax=Rhabditophanes sp. KR3021 TaxID=114890 RepID=A0AC35UCD0_9BILA
MVESSPKRMRYICDISGMDGSCRPCNVGSLWHSVQDNERLFKGLGVDTFTIATAICKMRVGSKGVATYDEYRGVAVFVKDFARRCNFIRIYHNTTLTMLYEMELLDMFKHKVHRSDTKRLTIWMGQHCIDLIFIDRNDLGLFRNKLHRVGVEKVNPSLTKRVQNCWDRAKGLVNGIFQEKGNHSFASQYSDKCGPGTESFEPRRSTVTKYMYRKPKEVRAGQSANNTPVKLVGGKRKMAPSIEDSPHHSTAKKGTSVYVTPSETDNQRLTTSTLYESQSNVPFLLPPQITFPSPPETPRGVIKNQPTQTIECRRKTEHFALANQHPPDDYEHKRYSCDRKYIPPGDNIAEPPIVKGLIRTVPRPTKYPPPPPPSNMNRSSMDQQTPSSKPLPIDLLADIRSAPNLRAPNDRMLMVASPHRLHQQKSSSPFHLIRSAMVERRISMVGDGSEGELDGSGWSVEDTDWQIMARALRPNYHKK